MTRTVESTTIRLAAVFICLLGTAPVYATWDCVWWDNFDIYDGTYVFGDYYNLLPTGTYWHVTEKTSAFTRRMSRDCSLWYGNEDDGTYADDVADCAALVTDPFSAGGTAGGDDREVVVVFWQWIETENLYGRDICSVYIDRNNGNWTCLYRNYRITPGWEYQVCESYVVPAATNIRIKLEFDTNGDIRNEYAGWFIDEFYVLSQPVGSKSRESAEALKAIRLLSGHLTHPGPQIPLLDSAGGEDESKETISKDEPVDQVPAMSFGGILLLMVLLGGLISHRQRRSTPFLILILTLAGVTVHAYPALNTLKITESDGLYDGKPDIASSSEWGLAVWEKTIRNTTKLMYSTWAQEGDEWSDEFLLETGNLTALRNPDVARDQDDPDLFWIAFEGVDANGKRNVYAGRFDFDAGTWSYSQVNGTSYDASVSPAVNGDTSHKRVAFAALLNGGSKIYSSEWNGSGWAANAQVNDSTHYHCAEPSLSGSSIVYSAENSSGYREIYYKTRHPSGGWWGLITVSAPVDAIPEIHPVIKSYPGSPSRLFVGWIQENQGEGDRVMFRDRINYTWGATEALSYDSLHTFFDMAYESQNQCLILLTERKTYDDWTNHKLHYYRRDYRTPTPLFGGGLIINYGGLHHKMDISLCDFHDGYSLAVWSGSPRENNQTDLSDRSIVFDTISESPISLTPAPTGTPVYPLPTPTPPSQGNYNWCGIDPTLPLHTFSYDVKTDIDYGSNPDPIMFNYRSYSVSTTYSWVIHGWNDIISDTGCIEFDRGRQFWFSFDPSDAVSMQITHPIDVSGRWYNLGAPGTATPTPVTPIPPQTPRPTCTAAPNPALSPYVSMAPWRVSPSRNGVLAIIVGIPPNCSGPPGSFTIQYPGQYNEIVVAQSSDWVWDNTAGKWVFLWDGLFTDNQGKRVAPPSGYCFVKVYKGSGWSYFNHYRSIITIE